jgi:hypothetical protein
MHLKGLSMTLLFASLILFVGCGGGDGQSGGQQNGAAGEAGKQGGEAANNAPEVKIALGKVASVAPEQRKIVLRPSSDVQGGEREVYKVIENAKITLEDEEAELTDIKEGQQAQIQYIVVDERNRARSVTAFDASGEGG